MAVRSHQYSLHKNIAVDAGVSVLKENLDEHAKHKIRNLYICLLLGLGILRALY